MLIPKELVLSVIRPTLDFLNLGGLDAEKLLLGTALSESGLVHINQIKGPAHGIYQMELETHDDIWANYLRYHSALGAKVTQLRGIYPYKAQQMDGNLFYATAMCRVKYLRVPDFLPDGDYLEAVAEYWKKWYNTPLGKGTIEHFIASASIITDPHSEIWT